MKHSQEIPKKNLFLSILALCFLICWVATLPKRAVLFPQMTPTSVRVLNGLAFTLATVFGVLVGRLCYKKFSQLKSMLVLSTLLCLAGTVFLYALPPDFQFIPSLITFVFFGFSFAFVSQFMLSESTRTTRVFGVGAIVFTRVFLSFLGNVKVPILASIPHLLTSILCITIVILSVLLVDRHTELAIAQGNTASSRKKTMTSFLFLILYFVIISVSKGILVQAFTHDPNYNPVYFSAGMIVSYALALFLILTFSSRPHLRNIIYIANSIMIIALTINLSIHHSSWMVLLIYSMLYFSFSINEVFCFDTLFEFGELFGSGSLVFGIAFASGSLAQLGGVLFYDSQTQAHAMPAEFYVVILFAMLTLILPRFLIELSKISPSSVFRVPAFQYYQGEHQISPAETTVPNQGVTEQKNGLKNVTAVEVLSDRENEVLELVLQGFPNKLICAELFISGNTLKSHIQSIYSKLGVHSRSELFLLLKKD